ncbi:glycosyltransferase family 1 protein [Uliginosibacterium sediminicola]|uniref:Glycosyltransferase family 1 protein n=1 Tax=Uliginosibacterium sediminicola TaxID=2024550 RepID=A0ABU9Z3T6_9RHOO
MYKIAADLRWPAASGIGVVAQELVSRLRRNFIVDGLDLSTRIGSPLSPCSLSYALLKTGGHDIFWNPGFVPPVYSKRATVVTVHDLTHRHFYTKAHRLYYDIFLKGLYRRADRIVCVSEYSRQEFCEWSGVPEDRVHVVYNGVSSVFVPEPMSAQVSEPYVFYPGNYRSYKNLERLIRAFALSDLPRAGVALAFTGHGNESLLACAKTCGVEHHLRFLGVLEQSELVATYRKSLGVAFVSLYEGFGLPIVEGMAVGVPVLIGRSSCLPEIAGGAAIMVDPREEDSIADGLNKMIFDEQLRRDLVVRGSERVKYFSWDKSAEAVKNIILSLV